MTTTDGNQYSFMQCAIKVLSVKASSLASLFAVEAHDERVRMTDLDNSSRSDAQSLLACIARLLMTERWGLLLCVQSAAKICPSSYAGGGGGGGKGGSDSRTSTPPPPFPPNPPPMPPALYRTKSARYQCHSGRMVYKIYRIKLDHYLMWFMKKNSPIMARFNWQSIIPHFSSKFHMKLDTLRYKSHCLFKNTKTKSSCGQCEWY